MERTIASHAVPERLAERVAQYVEHQALRLRVWWSHWSLDASLAAGVDPASDPALVMREARHAA